MKKILTTITLAILICLIATSYVNAMTQSELQSYLTGAHTINGETVYASSEYVTRIERYLSTHTLTDEQCAQIKAKVEEGISLLNKAGVTDPEDLSKEDKAQLLSIGQSAAAIVDLTLTYNSGIIELRDANGTLIDSAGRDYYKLVQTGSTNYAIIIVPVVALIAVAAVIVVKKVK